MSQQEQSQGTLTKQKRTAFVMSPHHLFCNSNITSEAKSLWVVLESKPEGWKFFWSEILKHFKEGRDQMIRAMGELEKLGYIQKKRAKKGNLYSGMDIQVFYDPLLPFDPHQQNQDPARDPEIQGTEIQEPENQASESQSPENQGTYKKKSKQKGSSNKDFISLPPEEKEKKVNEIFDRLKLKSDRKKYFLFRESKNWKGVANLEADILWWEDGHKEKFPELHVEKQIARIAPNESEEIQALRKEIKALISRSGEMQDYEFFIGRPIEKTPSGFVIKVEDERALKYHEVLRKINVEIEKV